MVKRKKTKYIQKSKKIKLLRKEWGCVSRNENLDKAFYMWLLNTRHQNIPVSGIIFKVKALHFAKELGCFIKHLQKKSMHLKGEKCSGGKNCKIRLSRFAAANMCAEKLLMFVIGKSNKPRCFKRIRSTPCRYRAQKKSCMTSELFEEWVKENDRKFALEGRKVALVIDNCTAHPNIENLKSVTLYFFSRNTTSYLQLMDQGVIRSLK